MLTIQKSAIPEYLRHGELYRTLMENNDDPNEEVTFPAEVLKFDTSVDSVVDVDHLLNSVRFWGVEEFVSTELIVYILFSCPDGTSVLKVLQKYVKEFKWIRYSARMLKAHTFDKLKVAIKSGMIELVQPLAQRRSLFPSYACDLAAEVGNLDVFICLYKHGCTWNSSTGNIAARQGHSNILEFMEDRGYKVTINDVRAAIQMGRVECVTSGVFAMSLSKSRHSGLCDIAAQHGHLAILQYLHEVEGRECYVTTTAMAAEYGHLHCLQYLHENGCPSEEQYICKYAASAGHLDCLQYAHKHGCVFDSSVVAGAASASASGGGGGGDGGGGGGGGHLACLRYAHTHGCTWMLHSDRYGGACVYFHNGSETQSKVSNIVMYTNPCWEYLYKHANKIFH